ncbi:hypothetical protein [Saccharothrix obliqua]|uniref:hypothetical protein n=1 Tax=Saccharothrix obliqua TaxID=2861747 RepID=UPI001C5EDB15|nr:hypothetical protein [Saccharothrix obliqua]MBW4722417.1 hypothetical protein [Saccharothrix obliqua]
MTNNDAGGARSSGRDTACPCGKEHPHGWLGYVVSDPYRTANTVRLLRPLVVVAVVLVVAAAGTMVVLGIAAPMALVGLAGGGIVGTASHVVMRARRAARGTRTTRRRG